MKIIPTALLIAMGVALASCPATAQQRYPLWAHGAPGYEDRATIPELSQDYWTKRVNNPSITAYLPDPKNATGTAIVILPGGGHELLVTTTEGGDVAHWLADRGVAAFVVRYRLFREKGSPYTETNARADAERAMRTVRARAADFHIDPHRIGVWGFSAGGELARMVTLSPSVSAEGTPDAVDRVSEKPDFAILEFPGPLHAEEHVTAD
ncbi:MAG: alpha/beta hydrolase, partial [Sphingomonas sp.]